MADEAHLFPGILVRTNILELQSLDPRPGKIIRYLGNGFYEIQFPGVIRRIHYTGLDPW
jgi:hypothetical protein